MNPTVETQNHLTLRSANRARQLDWCPDQVPDLSFRGNELAGETGEVCNVIKKLERERQGWRGSRDTVEHLAEELADVVICADLIAIASGIDLERAVAVKFNATSEKVGLPQRIEFEKKRADLADLEKYIEEAKNLALRRKNETIEFKQGSLLEAFYNGQIAVLEGVWVRFDQLFGDMMRDDAG